MTLHIVGGALKLEGEWFAVQVNPRDDVVGDSRIVALFKSPDDARQWAERCCVGYSVITLVADGEP